MSELDNIKYIYEPVIDDELNKLFDYINSIKLSLLVKSKLFNSMASYEIKLVSEVMVSLEINLVISGGKFIYKTECIKDSFNIEFIHAFILNIRTYIGKILNYFYSAISTLKQHVNILINSIDVDQTDDINEIKRFQNIYGFVHDRFESPLQLNVTFSNNLSLNINAVYDNNEFKLMYVLYAGFNLIYKSFNAFNLTENPDYLAYNGVIVDKCEITTKFNEIYHEIYQIYIKQLS